MQQKTVSRDTPLAEITLRKYEKPGEMQKRDLVKKLCLSIGLLQPGDSRDVVVDILHVMIETKQPLNSDEIQRMVIDYRKKRKIELNGIAPSNIRRQLKRLRDLFLVEKVKNTYRIAEDETLENIFQEKIKRYYIDSIISRVEDYFKALK